MKKKKFLFACGGALLALAIPVIANSNGGLTLFGYNANADGGLYSLKLNRNTNTLDFEGDTTTVTTTLGNRVNFTHSGVTKLEGKVGVLAAGGYIQNTEKITGMTSITVQFSGTLTIEYAWENTTMLVKEELTSGVEYTFYDKAPSYFKLVNTGAEDAEIDLIDINYSCEYTIKKVVQINYLYKETSEEISSPTYLILDLYESYGEEGVTGKGKITVGSKTYLPNLFYVAGFATENKVVNITYTEASVYDGTYDPATDTTRVLKGDGTSTSPYQINSAEDLIWAQAQTHGAASAANYYELNTSVDLTGYTKWYGFYNKKVTSTSWSWLQGGFDGNGYTVSGLSNGTSNYTAVSFISNLDAGAVFKDLTLEGKFTTNLSNCRIGCAGYQIKGTASNIISFVDLVYSKEGLDGNKYMGGLYGSATGGAVIEHCDNYGDISAASGNSVAGIAGYATLATIKYCNYYGDVSAGTSYWVAGIAGSTTITTIEYCNNYGDITTGGQKVGGIVGQAGASNAPTTIGFCGNYGNIKGQSAVSGICGWTTNSSILYGCTFAGSINNATSSGAFMGYSGKGCKLYGCGAPGHPEATEEYPAPTIIVGANSRGTIYPNPGKFYIIGSDKNVNADGVENGSVKI